MPEERPPAPATAAGRGPGLALGFALAAVAACWNPFAAPFGALVGLGAAALAVGALRRRARPVALGIAALVLALGAAVASLAILLATAGAITTELPGEPVVRGRTDAEAAALLDEAGRKTAGPRARARAELEKGTGALAPAPSAQPAGSASDGADLQPEVPGGDAADEDETE